MVTACWPGGMCFSDNSRSPLNTVRGLSTLMLMASPVSVASVSGRIVRWDCRTSSTSDLVEQPFAASAMGDSMDTYVVGSCETWVAAIHLDEATCDLLPPDSDPDLIASSHTDKTLTIVQDWVWASTPLAWSDCAGLSPELRLFVFSSFCSFLVR